MFEKFLARFTGAKSVRRKLCKIPLVFTILRAPGEFVGYLLRTGSSNFYTAIYDSLYKLLICFMTENSLMDALVNLWQVYVGFRSLGGKESRSLHSA